MLIPTKRVFVLKDKRGIYFVYSAPLLFLGGAFYFGTYMKGDL
ncbi:Hypothetical protein ACI5QN_00177 [Bacillus cereus]